MGPIKWYCDGVGECRKGFGKTVREAFSKEVIFEQRSK